MLKVVHSRLNGSSPIPPKQRVSHQRFCFKGHICSNIERKLILWTKPSEAESVCGDPELQWELSFHPHSSSAPKKHNRT